MKEPEKITIVEGPSPEFRPASQRWNIGIHQGFDRHIVGWLELRTANGDDIHERCTRAWREGRKVQLDYPDELRMRQTIDVVALRLDEIDEGTVLNLWVHMPLDEKTMQKYFDNNDQDDDDGFLY